MKRLISAASVVAVSAIALPVMAADQKPYSLSATLRGFYDDNYGTAPDSPAPGTAPKRSSWGFEVSPSAKYELNEELTQIKLGYVYDMRYYQDRADLHSSSADHSHEFNASLVHEFTERYKVSVKDSFAIAQEAALIDATAAPLRSNGNNLRNTASAQVDITFTRLFSSVISYQNTLYDYQQTGFASRSAELDRLEHLISADFRWQALPTTVALIGYQYGIVDHTSKDLLFAGTPANVRDNDSHYGFVGVDHNLTTDITLSLRAGVQYTEYPNAPAGTSGSNLGPYIDASGTYTLSRESAIQVGVRHTRSQTDLGGITAPTLDQEITTVYGTVNYKFTPRITGSLVGQYQYSTFNQGNYNNLSEQFIILGVNVGYEINQFLTAEVGYDYDKLSSDVANRGFTRNRVYMGIKATY